MTGMRAILTYKQNINKCCQMYHALGKTKHTMTTFSTWQSWRKTGTVVECLSVTGELSPSYAWPAADGWPLRTVNRSLQGQPTRQTQLSSFQVDKLVSCNRMCATSLGWRHLVNAYGVDSRWFIPFVDKRVGSR